MLPEETLKTDTASDVEMMSKVINLLRIPMIVMVVILHSYTATQNMDWAGRNGDLYKALSYELSLVLGNVAVPVFFFISGYLFFLHEKTDKINYCQKWGRRIKTLLVPYILWNIMTIGLYLVLQILPPTAKYFTSEQNIIYSYSLEDFFRAFWDCGQWNSGNGTPVLSPFWFIRNLIILSLLSPVIHKLNEFFKIWWILPLVLLWCVTYNMATPYESIIFFSIGSFLGEKKINISAYSWKMLKILMITEVCLFIAHNYLHFYTEHIIAALFTQRMLYVTAIPLIFTLGAFFVKKGFVGSRENATFAFVIFACHYPILLAVRKVMVKMMTEAGDVLSALFYIGAVGVVVMICWFIYKLLLKVPFLCSVLCGGR